MRTGLVVLGLLALVLVAFGVAWGLGRLPISMVRLMDSQQGEAVDATLGFLDDLKFKDYKAAASKFAPADRESVDVERLVERLFSTRPEALEILESSVVYVEPDFNARRARVKARTHFKDLGHNKTRDIEQMYYFYRNQGDTTWYIRVDPSWKAPAVTAPAQPAVTPDSEAPMQDDGVMVAPAAALAVDGGALRGADGSAAESGGEW